MDELGLIEDLQRQSGDNRAVLLVIAVFPPEASGGFDDLTAVRTFFVITNFRDDFQKQTVLQSYAGNDDFFNACLLDDFLKHDRGGYDDVRPVRPQAQLLDTFFEGHGPQFLYESLQF